MQDKVITRFCVSVIGVVVLLTVLHNTPSFDKHPDLYYYFLYAFISFFPPILFMGILGFSTKYRRLLYSSILLWFLLTFFLYFPDVMYMLYPAHESSCKLYLRALSVSENAFFLQNKEYATFEKLLKNGYIKQGYTSTNFIDQYRVEITFRKAVANSEQSKGFTIFAYPQPTVRRFSYLKTFYVTENEITHVVESK